MNGVININKPPGWTSHDVVAKARGLLKEKQIGHLGTLDPMATGVLPLAVGIATRLIEFSSYSKEYVATCLLGKSTDSCDVTGKTINEKDPAGLSGEKIREELFKLKNITEQTPPMVSAVKFAGKKLYELARQGKVVERKPRAIKIEELEPIREEVPRVTFRVVCSAGTYIRVLCQSLGEALAVGGCMESLERTRVGPFHLSASFTLEDVKKKTEEGNLSGMLLPSGSLVSHLGELRMGGPMLSDLCHGKKMNLPEGSAGTYRILNPEGLLCSVAEVSESGELRPRKVFGVEGIL